MVKRLTISVIVERLEKAWLAENYDYELLDFNYKGRQSQEIFVNCKKHGVFKKTVKSLLEGRICTKCKNQYMSKEEFLEKAFDSYGSNLYNFEKAEFVYGTDQFSLNCIEHGEFTATVIGLLKGRACQRCGVARRSVSFKEFKRRAIETHGENYEYSEKHWDGGVKTLIGCFTHGLFQQNWYNHVTGNGCRACAVSKSTFDNIEIQKRLDEIHGMEHYVIIDKLESSTKTKCAILCSTHGEQMGYLNNLLRGQLLQCCHKSKLRSNLEVEIETYVRSIYHDRVIITDRTLLQGKELDIYLPEIGLAIEVNGDYWHSSQVDSHAVSKHAMKIEEAFKNGVTLIYVWEVDWLKNKSKVKEELLTLINAGVIISNFKEIPSLFRRITSHLDIITIFYE